MSNFRPVDRETGFLLPPSVEEWLPERHLARFVVEVIEQLDLSAFVKAYRGSGSASYHPSMLLGLLVYGYATGVFSSRKLERATYDSVAFRFIAANDHPDHDTIAAFRRRFLDRIEGLFVEVLLLAREAGVLKLGTVALDGTKVHPNASRHSALSWKHACELEARLKAEVAELMALAEAADGADVPDGMSVPEELARREDRLARIAEAKAVIEARARERLERERAEYEAKLEARAEKARMARENRDWGYDRIVGALGNLGHRLSDETVGNILRRRGIAPAPQRKRTTTWKEFIRSHRAVLAGTDFFTVEVLTLRGLVTFYVLFFVWRAAAWRWPASRPIQTRRG